MPILRPGDSVVMDDLSSHKASVIRTTRRATGAKLKTLLRKLNARTIDAVINTIGQVLAELSA